MCYDSLAGVYAFLRESTHENREALSARGRVVQNRALITPLKISAG